MLGWIFEKMATQALAPGGGRFFASSSTVAGNGASTCNNPCALSEDCSTAAGNGSWGNTHTFDLFCMNERPSREPCALVQHAQRTGGNSDG